MLPESTQECILLLYNEAVYAFFCEGWPTYAMAAMYSDLGNGTVRVSFVEWILKQVEIQHNGKSTIPAIPETFALA